jgi:hypothetical protein
MLPDSQLRLSGARLLVGLDLGELDCRHNGLEWAFVVEESSRELKLIVLIL